LSRGLFAADACALVDAFLDTGRLGEQARIVLRQPSNRIVVLATTIWEIGIKTQQGKLEPLVPPASATLSDMLAAKGFDLQPFTPALAEVASALPPHHRDPFDRALIAFALTKGITVVTNDGQFAPYGVETLW
jgi:PIN domain nuclease of toxin-antitoxin system